ncbi:MAG: hypothetical protein M3115_04405 [Thermoproteota archaeon]|nr:hypothetical protein [Thermoproteota archaeon]
MTTHEREQGRRATSSKRNGLVLTATVVLASILVMSIAVFSPIQRGFATTTNMTMDTNNQNGNTNTAASAEGSSLPQPNDNSTILKAQASNALFEPAAGLSNVFGPGGLFPFEDVFTCADALTCGVSAGEDATFSGTFEEGNRNNLTEYTATYTSPVTYGPHQIEGHTYQIELTDTQWNSTDAAMPTRQAEFASMVNNVGLNQIQHGASMIDRSDVPQLYDHAFLYGHARITDITNGNNTVVAEDVFTHVMVAHVMDEDAFYQNFKGSAASPTMVFLFTVNIPSDTELPGVGSLSPEEAQGFTPLPTDPSLTNPPPVEYPVELPAPREGAIEEPEPQSTVWPVANPNQPLLFNFLVYQDAQVTLSSTGAENTMTSTNATTSEAINTTVSANDGELTGAFFP